jgi:hypothetical protein
MVPNGATLTFEDVTRRPLKSIPGSVLTFPRPNCSQSGVIYKQQITDAYGNIKVVPLLPRNDMTGAWMYLSKDGGICNYFADARVNAGVARVVWIPRDPNGSLNPQKHVLRALQSTNKFEIGLSPNYSAPTAGPELFEDLKWACADGQRFDSYDDARAYAFLLYATRCNDRNDGCASPGTRISLLSGSWESESADGTDGSTAGCEVKANANADALVDTEKPAYTNVDGYCYPKFRPSASLEDPMMELVHKNLDSRPTTEVHEDLSKSAYTNIDGYLYPNIWPATSLDEHEKESNESTIDSHATTEAHEDASKPAYTNIDGHVSPNFHPTTPLNGWKNQCGVPKAPESQAAAMSSLARRLRACVIDHSEWKSKTGEENFELYVKSDSHGGYGDYSHYALDGACDLLSRPCTPPPHPRGWKTEPDDGENHDSKEDSHVALEGADSAGLRYYTPPACGWKVETTEELYAFYANDHPKSCVVPPLSVSRNVSGDIAAQTSASHFERSGALSPENSSPDLSFSDANSFPGVQSATSPLNSNASVLESAAAGARASPSPIVEPLNPSDSVDWTPLMNDIANMLTKETVTEFKSDANVPVQSESGLQIAAHVPTCPGDTCSCVVCLGVDASSDSGKSDDTGIALSHVSSIASDSDDTPRCHFNKNLFGSNGWLDQTNIPKADTNRRVSSGRFKGLGQTVKAHIKDLVSDT